MKKIILLLLILLLTGCSENDKQVVISDLENKINKLNSYQIQGTLKMLNNEEMYIYDVEVAYQKKDNFRVSLINKTNNHKQIILKNKDGVYVLTPSLNKSLKFESKWPYNNSQIYILQSLLKDIKGDKNYNFNVINKGYAFKTLVNYPNNENLAKQKIYLNKKKEIKRVVVLNKNNEIQMDMKFNKIDYNTKFDKKYFNLNFNMSVTKEKNIIKKVNKIDEGIYPMYLPKNTYLDKEDKIEKENGERIIMTFKGDNSFVLIEETAEIPNDNKILKVSGNPEFLSDTIGVFSKNEVSWFSDGVMYYILADDIKNKHLMNVSNSIGVASIIKSK